MSRGKSADRSGCSLVAEVVSLVATVLLSYRLLTHEIMKSEASPQFVPAECARRLAI